MSDIQEMRFEVTGMTCAACSNRIEKVLNKMDYVEAQVNLTTEQAAVSYNPETVTFEDIQAKIEKIGYGVKWEQIDLAVEGMTCAACANRIEKVLNKQQGIQKATVNLATESASVHYQPSIMDTGDMINRIQKLGYDAKVKEDSREQSTQKEKAQQQLRMKLIISAVLTIPLFATMLIHLFNIPLPGILMNPWFQLVLATPVQFFIGWRFYRGAYKNLRNKTANMDVLVALGTSVAYFYSLYETLQTVNQKAYEPHLYFETSAVIITLILFGKYLETAAKSKTTTALKALLELQAKEARVIRENKEHMLPVSEVVVGDHIIVKPGEKIPVDGTIIKGHTSIDESMITGESIPVEKSEADQVIGSTINKHGSITLEATKVGKDTALASIIKVVEDAQGSKAPIQRLADVIAGYFVQIVVAIAIVTLLIWMLFIRPGELEPALLAMIAVLVIACPCALGLATPTSIMVGTGKAAELGILFKGGEHLERTHQLDAVIFDKTGTLTNGRPEVTDYQGDRQTLQLLASAEYYSEHPLAEAIVTYANQQQLTLSELDSFEAVPGRGIQAEIEGEKLLAGNRKWLAENGIQIDTMDDTVKEYENAGKTAMLIAINGSLTGVIAVADTIKDSASEAIRRLHAQGLEVMMLTGDNQTTAEAIADQLGIKHVFAEVLPEQKAEKVKEVQLSGNSIAMVGDGINDAPALAVADIGIAIGTGTEVAIEAADVTILGGDLLLLPKAIQLSHATIRNIRQNLFWAFAYNSAGIPIAAAGILAPWIAGAAMAFSSVSVVTNALRLKRVKI
ncbi:heavy metal translocating P-type ATPase [Gracilibacillus caseinilyticus]|uniref:Copper-exporting P-type ATPase n=1 Tax=Gracilibacillus caseinilyticus TaxID=2932256 RepID=A0ABY4ERE9_9BACI|nr:heavy metal translocating P-type ATPase [Gracilibacillus caseinilyticus]UOQ47001.1 heavy metal translocating P-type ATPase [Gracilibacillus caseinilyticus]